MVHGSLRVLNTTLSIVKPTPVFGLVHVKAHALRQTRAEGLALFPSLAADGKILCIQSVEIQVVTLPFRTPSGAQYSRVDRGYIDVVRTAIHVRGSAPYHILVLDAPEEVMTIRCPKLFSHEAPLRPRHAPRPTW